MGKRRGFATLQTSDGDLINVSTRPAPVEHSENMPYGAFVFEVHGIPAGPSIDMDLYLSLDNNLNQLLKEIDETWTEIEDAAFSPGDNRMRISFSIPTVEPSMGTRWKVSSRMISPPGSEFRRPSTRDQLRCSAYFYLVAGVSILNPCALSD